MITTRRNTAVPALSLVAALLVSNSAFAEKPSESRRRATPRSVDHRRPSTVSVTLERGEDTEGGYYRGSLALAYAVPVAITTLSSPTLLFEDSSHMVFFAGVAMTPILPPVVHLAHGNDTGALRSFLGILGSGALGLGVGVALGASADQSEPCQEFCDAGKKIGAVLGANIAYTIWGIVDVAAFAYTAPEASTPNAGIPKRKPPRHGKPITMLPSISPMPISQASGHSRPGVLLSLSGTF